MIWPGEEPRDYEFRSDWDSDYTRDTDTGGVEAVSTLSIKWGSVGEILLTMRTWITTGEPVVGPTIDYEITLETPWDTDQTFTGSVWLGQGSDFPARIELDDVSLAVEDCDAYDFEFSELRLRLDGSVEYTLGAQTDSNTGYDVRENRVRLTADRNPDPPPLGSDPVDLCPVDPFTLQVDLSVTGGYRYSDGAGGWLYDVIDFGGFEPPSPPPVGGCATCDCEESLDYPGLDPDRPELTDSWYVTLSGQGRYNVTKELQGTFECGCDPPEATTQTGIWDVWFYERSVRLPEQEATVDPIGKGVLEHLKQSGAACYCTPGDTPDYGTDEETTDEAHSLARYDVEMYRLTQFKQCCDETQTAVCFLDPGPPPPPPITYPTCEECSGIDEDEAFCIYLAYSRIEYPTEPDCLVSVLSYDVSPSWRHVRATADEDDAVYFQVSPNVQPRLSWSGPVAAGFDAVDGTVRWLGSSGVLGFLYAKPAGGIGWRTSVDEGASWGSETLLSATGTRAGFVRSRSTAIYLYWIDAGAIKGQVWDAAENVLDSTFTLLASGADDYPLAVDESFDTAGNRRVRFQFVAGGNLTERYSTDGRNLV